MPLNISKVGKVLKELNRVSDVSEFNANLPVKIEVKKQLNPIRYLIKLGKKEIETKSYLPLEVGKKYLAEIKEIKNSINISNLKEFPKLMQKLENVTHLLKENDLNTKEHILKHLANSNSKTEFLFFTNILMAFERNIHHLIINEKKKALMQYKYKKNKLKFYAVFEHLGELEGELTPNVLTIISPYSATLSLIEKYSNELDFEIVLIKKEVKPLYEFSDNLLNLKV